MGGNMSSNHPPKKITNFTFHVESGGAINIFHDSPLPLPNPSSSPAKEITYPSPHPLSDSFSHSGDKSPRPSPYSDITYPSPGSVISCPDDNVPKSPSPSPYSVNRFDDNIPKKEITHPSPSDTCAVVLKPVVFSGFGKQANDLLTKDYHNKDMDKNFINLQTRNAGVYLTLTPLEKNDTTSGSTIHGLFDDLTLIYKFKNNNNNNSIHLKINVAPEGGNCFSTTTQVQYELVPDIMNVFMSMEYPDMTGGGFKFRGQYFIPDANLNVTASSTLCHDLSPILEGSATVGTPSFAIGGDVVFDSKKSEIHYRAGIHKTNSLLDEFSFVVSDDKTVKCLMKKSCFVAELKKKNLTNIYEVPAVTMGTSFEVDHRLKEMKTVVKAKVAIDNHIKMGVVLKQQMTENRMLKIFSEFDLMALNKTPKIGLSLVL